MPNVLSLASLLPALALMLAPTAPSTPADSPLPLVEETHLRVALLPEEGRVDLRVRLELAPPEEGGGRMLLLQVSNDLRALSVRGPSGEIRFRQGGNRLLLFPDR